MICWIRPSILEVDDTRFAAGSFGCQLLFYVGSYRMPPFRNQQLTILPKMQPLVGCVLGFICYTYRCGCGGVPRLIKRKEGSTMPDFATKLYILRNQAGLSQTVCAEMLEVSRQTVSKWELGVSVPEVSKLVAISNLFSVSTDYLLKDDAETPVSGNMDRLVLRFLGYAQEMEEVSEQLVAMM